MLRNAVFTPRPAATRHCQAPRRTDATAPADSMLRSPAGALVVRMRATMAPTPRALATAALAIVVPALLFLAGPAGAAPRGVVLEDFESGAVSLISQDEAQDQDPDGWEVVTSPAYGGSAFALRVYGNSWKAQEIDPYPIHDGTVLQAAIYTPEVGEMNAIGIGDGVNTLYYTCAGTYLPASDPWEVVYQGAFPDDDWNLYLLPVGRDWFSRYGYYPSITRLVYVNDHDDTPDGVTVYDAIVDVTGDLPQAPQVTILRGRQTVEKISARLYRVGIQFGAQVQDPDTPPEAHTYHWDFGDSTGSFDPAPFHEFIAAADYTYTVTLAVRDPDGMWGRDTTQVTVEPGAGELPITMNFVGDIMLARGYDQPGGLIDQYGPEWIFAPTLPYFGAAAEINVANLECPLTDEGTPHPTKSIVFRGRPSNVAGVASAGIDVVSLGNNHIIDYGQRGMEETQEMLDANGILWCGADDDDYGAQQPVFVNRRGVALAFLGQCNRTGREYNYQPFLDAGYNKPGFAWITGSNLDRAIGAAGDLADLVVIQLHAGIEYATGPGTIAQSGWPLEGTSPGGRIEATGPLAPHPIDPADRRFHPAGEPPAGAGGLLPGTDVESAGDGTDEFLFPTRPSLTDRQLRWHAVETGADLVICHHPHVLQGFEVYDGVLIAHSLGNFVFDQSYAETFPSLILATEFDKEGFRSFTFRPAFVDDWVPHVVSGRLGREILDRQAEYSRELNTVVTVDPAAMEATIHLHPEHLVWQPEVFTTTEPLVEADGYWVSPPVERGGPGTLARILAVDAAGPVEVRVGRELLWHGDMEDEGATFWNLNSSYEGYDATVAHQGQRSIRLRRSGGSVSTDLQGYPALLGGQDYSLSVWIRTENAAGAGMSAQFYTGRGSGLIADVEVAADIDGTTDWTRYWRDLSVSQTPWFFEVKPHMDRPASGEGSAWFDEARLIAWEAWQPAELPLSCPYPSNLRYLQVRTSEAASSVQLSWEDVQATDMSVSVEEGTTGGTEIGTAGRIRLGRPQPNPFRSQAGIEYRLSRPGAVRLEIFDLQGRRIATLVDEVQEAGAHRADWQAGSRPAGLYFVRLAALGEIRVEKLALVR